MFKPKEDKDDATKKAIEANPQLVLACQQIVDCLVELDCHGECGGNAQFDDCGVCEGDNTSCGLIGDLNEDQVLNVLDIVLIVNHIFDLSPYNPIADINSDGIVNVLDIVGLVNLIFEN